MTGWTIPPHAEQYSHDAATTPRSRSNRSARGVSPADARPDAAAGRAAAAARDDAVPAAGAAAVLLSAAATSARAGRAPDIVHDHARARADRVARPEPLLRRARTVLRRGRQRRPVDDRVRRRVAADRR